MSNLTTNVVFVNQVKSDFMTMLSESDLVTEQTQWKKVKGLFERDVRYKVVEGSAQREEWFNEHVKLLASKVRVEKGAHWVEEDLAINRLYYDPPPLPTHTCTHTHTHTHIQWVDPDQERQERIQASLKEREREVKMSRTAQEKEWDRERDQLRKSEATQHFKALLVDMVTNQYSSQPVINDHYNP